MQKYVLGFIFNSEMDHALLELKDHPDFLKDKYNGIGGKIKDGESAIGAMIRKCSEETGLNINLWLETGWIKGDDFHVQVFCHILASDFDLQNINKEKLKVFHVNNIDKIPLCNHTEDLIEMILAEKFDLHEAFRIKRLR